jgi:hypothetical protein
MRTLVVHGSGRSARVKEGGLRNVSFILDAARFKWTAFLTKVAAGEFAFFRDRCSDYVN